MSIHLDKRKAPVSLKSCLHNITKVLEKRNKVILRRIWRQISDVAGGLPLRRLLNDHVVALNTMGWEVMMSVGSSRSHSNRSHSSLLRNRRLTLLIGPVAPNRTRPQPLAIHRTQSLLRISAVAECNKAITPRTSGFHIPHDTSFRDGAKRREGLEKHFVVYLVGEIAHEDMEVVGRVFLIRGV